MSPAPDQYGCGQPELLFLHAVDALAPEESAAVAAHLATCAACRGELAALDPVVESMAAWPLEVLLPPASLWDRLTSRIAEDPGAPAATGAPEPWAEPEWEQVAPGIDCKLLATDTERHRVSMLVRLAPGAEYPPHRHAGVEELHLLEGELFINDRKLHAGDYNRAEPGTSDRSVRTETGCTCVLMTSTCDVIR